MGRSRLGTGGADDETTALAVELRGILGESLDRSDLAPGTIGHQKRVLLEYRLAVRVRDWAGGSGERFDALAEQIQLDGAGESLLIEWLLEQMPRRLRDCGLIDELIEHCTGCAGLLEPENFLGDLPVLLAEAGSREEALSRAETNLERFPDDVWIVIKAGDAFQECSLLERAEELYRRALRMAGPTGFDHDGVVERLLPLLEQLGKTEEAREIEKNERRAAEAASEPQRPVPDTPEPTHRAGPKIGRNDPCPCGSGKKFKKCCGPPAT